MSLYETMYNDKNYLLLYIYIYIQVFLLHIKVYFSLYVFDIMRVCVCVMTNKYCHYTQ